MKYISDLTDKLAYTSNNKIITLFIPPVSMDCKIATSVFVTGLPVPPAPTSPPPPLIHRNRYRPNKTLNNNNNILLTIHNVTLRTEASLDTGGTVTRPGAGAGIRGSGVRFFTCALLGVATRLILLAKLTLDSWNSRIQ